VWSSLKEIDMDAPTNVKKIFRRRKLFANKMHREMFSIVFLAALIPVVIATILLLNLIFYLLTQETGISEAAMFNIIPVAAKVVSSLAIIAPVFIIIILVIAHRVSHRMVGPLDRITRELSECVQGRREGPIVLRKTDKLWPLVTEINILLEKLKKE